MLEKEKKDKWIITVDPDSEWICDEYYDTKEGAIGEAKRRLENWYQNNPDIIKLFIGKTEEIPFRFTETLMEALFADLHDSFDYGEFATHYYGWEDDIAEAEKEELMQRLHKSFENWQEETGKGFTFFRVKQIEPVSLGKGE